MTKRIKKQVEKMNWYRLAELCERVNEDHKLRAMRKYLNGDVHAHFATANIWVDQCQERALQLRGGFVAPHLAICCCRDTFTTILATKPVAQHVSFEINVDDLSDEEADELKNRVVCCSPLEESTPDEIEGVLIESKDCRAVTTSIAHTGDLAHAEAYHKAVLNYLETAAAVAKGCGSDAARLFLEAQRLLTPREFLDRRNCRPISAEESRLRIISEEAATKAYDIACEAQGALWTDWKLSTLKPIAVKRRAKRPSKR